MISEKNVFAAHAAKAWPYRFEGRLKFRDLVIGGTPSDPKVARGWLQSKFQNNDEALSKMVAEVMTERQIDAKAALEVVGDLKLLKGFKKDDVGLFLEGRVLKACLKEAVAVSSSAAKIKSAKLGAYKAAGVRSFSAEHIQVVQNKLYLEVDGEVVQQPTGIQQRFVHTWRGNGISYEEYIDQAELAFTVISDWDEWGEDFWPMVWLTAGEQGLGASRSMSFGRFDVIQWDQVDLTKKTRTRKA